jgi:HEAT repeat protein
MRPKIVILTLLGAFVALAVIVLLKGNAGKNSANAGDPAALTQSTANDNTPATNPSVAAGPVAATAVSPEIRAAVIDKEVGDIQALANEADGTNNVEIITTLVGKLSEPEPEVRSAVIDGLRQMNDTNAVAPLQKAAESIQDAREKVAVLDLIDYLRMPSITQNVPPELTTNSAFVPGERKASHFKANGRPVPVGQPQ